MNRRNRSTIIFIVMCAILLNFLFIFMKAISSETTTFSSIKRRISMLQSYSITQSAAEKTEKLKIFPYKTTTKHTLTEIRNMSAEPKLEKGRNSGSVTEKQSASWNPKYIHYLMKETQSLKLEIFYEPFKISEPLFISENDRALFYKTEENLEHLQFPPPIKLRGEIHIIRNGTFKIPYDCGWRSNSSHMMKKRDVLPSNWYQVLVPLNVPDGNTFQHFLDGTLPKIIQAIDFLTYPGAKIILNRRPRDKILYEIFDRLNLSTDNFIFDSFKTYGARSLVSSCIAPPLHPQLWKTARYLLGAPEYRTGSWKDDKVILMTRKGSFNGGRNMLNQADVINMLNKRYGEGNLHIFKGPYNLKESADIFGKAKIVIGVHGGGLQNIIFCPENTVVIEIMPTYANGKLVLSHAGIMYWVQSSMLNLKYWRVALTPTSTKGDVFVDIPKLEAVLNEVDKSS